jgi:hypothetical protein
MAKRFRTLPLDLFPHHSPVIPEVSPHCAALESNRLQEYKRTVLPNFMLWPQTCFSISARPPVLRSLHKARPLGPVPCFHEGSDIQRELPCSPSFLL